MVETVLVLPLLILLLLGVVQLALAYQARLLTEYAAFKAVRAGVVYRANCPEMMTAAAMALAPVVTIAPAGNVPVATRYQLHAQQARENQLVGAPGVRLIRIERVVQGGGRTFDQQLNVPPMKLFVAVHHLYELRIPIVGWMISSLWRVRQLGGRWTDGPNPMMLTEEVEPEAAISPMHSQLARVEAARQVGRFTLPLTATWSMRMMSEPFSLGGAVCEEMR